MSTIEAEKAERIKKHRAFIAAHEAGKKQLQAELKKLVAAEYPVAVWKVPYNDAYDVKVGGGCVRIKLSDETTNYGFSSRDTGRFSVRVEPVLGDYTRSRDAATLFRARKEGWPPARVREIAAKIALGLAKSIDAHAKIAKADEEAKATKEHLRAVSLHDAPCYVVVNQRIDTVRYSLNMPTLTLNQYIVVADFVNALLRGAKS